MARTEDPRIVHLQLLILQRNYQHVVEGRQGEQKEQDHRQPQRENAVNVVARRSSARSERAGANSHLLLTRIAPRVPQLRDNQQSEERQHEQRRRGALAEPAALHPDLECERGEQMRRVSWSPAR